MTNSQTTAARGTTDVELILSFGTLRHASFNERVKAAAKAGYRGIGLSVSAYARMIGAGWSLLDMHRVLEAHDVRLLEIETLAGFAATPGTAHIDRLPGLRYVDTQQEALAFALADAFGSRHVQVIGAFSATLEPHAAEAFAALCDRAADHGLIAALEFVPCTNIPSVAAALRIIDEAGRANAGLCVDSWHFFRGTANRHELHAVPSDRIAMIQVNDGPRTAALTDYLDDTLRNRCCPGEGEFDLRWFLAELRNKNPRAAISVEVLSDDLDLFSPYDAAMRTAVATRAALAAL